MNNPNIRRRTTIFITNVNVTQARQTELHSHLMVCLAKNVPDIEISDVSITFATDED